MASKTASSVAASSDESSNWMTTTQGTEARSDASRSPKPLDTAGTHLATQSPCWYAAARPSKKSASSGSGLST
eukprot:3241697-Prymnesium_polylepis.1